MEPIRILVTGAGSGVCHGIIKALRLSDIPSTIFCSDISAMNAGLYRADHSLILPKVEAPDSLPIYISSLKKNGIQVVMIGSEFDLVFFAANKETIEKETGACVIVSPLKTILIADDKWLTAEFLRKEGLPYAESFVPETLEEAVEAADKIGYPLIFKMRDGTSGRHIYPIKHENQLRYLFPLVPRPMIQRMVDMPSRDLHNEYSCSVFKTSDGQILGPITVRRTLRGGTSWHMEVDAFPELHPLLISIGEKLPIMGSMNIQLMIGPDGPVPFEFNARFSGTTAVRAHFGFNEPEMSINNFFLKKGLIQPKIKKGMVFRYHEEIFVNDITAKTLKDPFPKGEIHRWF